MAKQLILVREPKMIMPEDFKNRLLSGYSTALGYASPQEGKRVDGEIFPGDEKDLEDALKQVEEGYADDRVFYHLMEGLPDFDSCQPFQLLAVRLRKEDEADTTVLAAMIEGDFAKWKPDQAQEFSNEYNFFQNFLKPKVTELWDLAGNDLELLLKMLDKKVFRDSLTEHFAPRGNLILIPAKGKALAYNDTAATENAGQFKWGFVTDTLGYEEATDKPVEAKTPDKPLTMKEKAALKAKGTTEPKPDDKKATPPGGTPITPEENYAPVLKHSQHNFFLEGGRLRLKPPKGADWKTARTWWNTHSTTERPEDGKVLYGGFDVENELRANSPIRAFIDTALRRKPAEAESEQGPADGKTEKPGDKKEPTDMTLFIPTDQKTKFFNLKKNGKLPSISDEKLKAKQEEYPGASIQLGEVFGDILNMSPEAYARIVHDGGSQLAICLLHEMRCRIKALEAADRGEKLVLKPDTVVGKTDAPGKTLTMKEKAALKAQQAA